MLAHILIFFLLLLMTSPGSITPILVLLKIERYFSRRNSIYSYLCSISFLRNRDKFLLWQIISSFTNRKYLILVNSSKNFWHLAKISLTYNVPPNHLSFYSMTVIRFKKKKMVIYMLFLAWILRRLIYKSYASITFQPFVTIKNSVRIDLVLPQRNFCSFLTHLKSAWLNFSQVFAF